MANLGKVSLVLPIYNEVAILQLVLDKIFADAQQIEKGGTKVEVIVVNDGCTDGSEDVLAKAAKMRRNLRVVNLDGRHGKQIATVAGMDAVDAKSNAVILADVDIATPLGLFTEMAWKIRDGAAIVYAKREAHGMRKLRRGLGDMVVIIGTKLFGVDGKYTGKTNVMAFSKPVADVIRELPERNKYLRAMDTWTGWNIEYMSYQSDLNNVEEKNILDAAHARVKSEPAIKDSKPKGRDHIREHTAATDVVWTLFFCCIMAFGAGLYFTAMNYASWVVVATWVGFATLIAVMFLMWIRAVMIKRVGVIHQKSFGYKVANVIN